MKTKRKTMILTLLSAMLVCLVGIAMLSPSFGAKAAEVPAINTFALDKAQARIDTDAENPKSGLRFVTTMSAAEYESLSAFDVSVSTLIIPRSVLGEGELSADNPDVLKIDVKSPALDGEEYQFRAVLSEKEGSNWVYTDEILAKSVLTIKEKGTETVLGTKETGVFGRNIAYIAYMALNDADADYTAAEETILQSFVGDAVFNPIIAAEGVDVTYGYKYAYPGQQITAKITTELTGKKITSVTVEGVDGEVVDLDNGVLSFTMPDGEVSIVTTTAFFDNTLEQNVLADFKEDYYKGAVSASAGNVAELYNENSAYKPDVYINNNMDGAIYWQGKTYDTLKVPFGETVNIAETGGIYVDILTNALFEASNFGIYAGFYNASAPTVQVYQKSFGFANPTVWWEPMRCYFPASLLLSHGVTEISFFELMVGAKIPAEVATTYVEEIGIIPKTADATELMNFDSADDDNYYFRWGMTSDTISVKQSGDAALPAGTEGGALSMTSGHAEQFTVFFKNSVNIADIGTLKIRLYAENADNISDAYGTIKNGIRVWLPKLAADTTTVVNAGECTHEPGAAAGWLEYTVTGEALAAMIADNADLAGLTELSGITIQKLGNQQIFIDSISYMPKA